MKETLLLMGKFDNLNKLLGAANHNRYVGAGIKKRNQARMVSQLQGIQPFEPHCSYSFHWHLSDKRQDPDNVATTVKYFFDALQEVNIIPNDNWEYVKELHHYYYSDAPKGNEYVEVEITNEQ